MKVCIFFKDNPHEAMSYEITLDEFKRLSCDYRLFIETGRPDRGVYKCYINGKQVPKLATPVALLFSSIASIV